MSAANLAVNLQKMVFLRQLFYSSAAQEVSEIIKWQFIIMNNKTIIHKLQTRRYKDKTCRHQLTIMFTVRPVAGFTVVDVRRMCFPSASSQQLHDLQTILEDIAKHDSRLPTIRLHQMRYPISLLPQLGFLF